MKDGFPAFGADAVRFYLATNPPQAKRINLQLRQVERARNFANKIWNATRFALPYLEPLRATTAAVDPRAGAPSLADRWILSRLAHAVQEVNQGIDEFRLDECTAAARRFFWDELCDWYLELSKPVLANGTDAQKDAARRVLGVCLETAFRLLHAFMPFITEEVWQKLPTPVRARRPDGSVPEHLVGAPFPAPAAFPRDERAEQQMSIVQGVIVAARNIRAELGIKPKDPITVRLRTDDEAVRRLLAEFEDPIRVLSIAREVICEPVGAGERPRGVGYAVAHGVEVLVPLAGLIEPTSEAARLEREIAKARKDVEKLEKTLTNPAFVERAPPETVAQSRAELATALEKVAKLNDALATVREAAS
jgi:valyl-tRNA synthetase